MANFTKGSLSIQEYFFAFQNLWDEYFNVIYDGIFGATLFVIQIVHKTSKRDQFLMKLRFDFEATNCNFMNRNPVPTLDACLSELLCEKQRIATHVAMEHNTSSTARTMWPM